MGENPNSTSQTNCPSPARQLSPARHELADRAGLRLRGKTASLPLLPFAQIRGQEQHSNPFPGFAPLYSPHCAYMGPLQASMSLETEFKLLAWPPTFTLSGLNIDPCFSCTHSAFLPYQAHPGLGHNSASSLGRPDPLYLSMGEPSGLNTGPPLASLPRAVQALAGPTSEHSLPALSLADHQPCASGLFDPTAPAQGQLCPLNSLRPNSGASPLPCAGHTTETEMQSPPSRRDGQQSRPTKTPHSGETGRKKLTLFQGPEEAQKTSWRKRDLSWAFKD